MAGNAPTLAADFDIALAVVGFNVGTRRAIGEQGYLTIESLKNLSTEDIEKMGKHLLKANPAVAGQAAAQVVKYPFAAIHGLKALQHWYKQRGRCGQPADGNLFTAVIMQATLDRMKEEEDLVKDLKGRVLKQPKNLKSLDEWRPFDESMMSLLAQMRGAAHCPIVYVAREQATEPAADLAADLYDDEDSRLIARTLLSGPHYMRDNKTVWDTLVPYVQDNKDIMGFIRKYKKTTDGREALKALALQAGGQAITMNRRDAAKAVFCEVMYTGPRRNFSFNDYIAKYQWAFNELIEIDETPTQESMVSDFLNGISDPSLEASKDIIMASPVLSASWPEAQISLKTKVASRIRSLNQSRSVAAVGSGRGFAPRSGRGGRLGRGGGRGRGGGSPTRYSDVKPMGAPYTGAIHAGDYQPADWARLSREQRNKVFELRRQD